MKSEKYEKTAKNINNGPTKLITLKNIRKVEDEINAMKIENRDLDLKLILKSKQLLHLIYAVNEFANLLDVKDDDVLEAQ